MSQDEGGSIKVVGLDGCAAGEPNKDVVKVVERALALAKSGQIVSFAYFGSDPEGRVRVGWEYGEVHWQEMVGCAEILKSDLIKSGDG